MSVGSCNSQIGLLFVPILTSTIGDKILLSYFNFIFPAFNPVTVVPFFMIISIVTILVPEYVSMVSVSGSKS